MLERFKWYRKFIGGRWYRIKYLDDVKSELFTKWSRFPAHSSESYRLVSQVEIYPYRSKDKHIERKVTEEIQENLKYRSLVKKCGEDYHNGLLKIETEEFAKELIRSNPKPLTLDEIMYAIYYALEEKGIVFHKPDESFKYSVYESIYVKMTNKKYIECLGLNKYKFRS